VEIHIVMHILPDSNSTTSQVSHNDAYLCACLLRFKWLWQRKWYVIEEICAVAF